MRDFQYSQTWARMTLFAALSVMYLWRLNLLTEPVRERTLAAALHTLGSITGKLSYI